MVVVSQPPSFSDSQTLLMRPACQGRGSRSALHQLVTRVELVRRYQGVPLPVVTRVACMGLRSHALLSRLLAWLVLGN